MKLKRWVALTSIFLLLFFCIGMTAANENTTIENVDLDSGQNLIDVNDESNIDDSENTPIEFNTPEVNANITITGTTVNVCGKTSSNLSNSYLFMGIRYSYDNNKSFHNLYDKNNKQIYDDYLSKNENFNLTCSDLKNGDYMLFWGSNKYYFNIKIPTTYNLTINGNNVGISASSNEKGEYLTLYYANDTKKDKYDTWLKNNVIRLNYTLTNGEYKFRLYNSYTKEESFIPFKIDIPIYCNVSINYNTVNVKFSVNHKFNYKLVDSEGNEVKGTSGGLSIGKLNQRNYTLANGDYTFKITGEEPRDIPITVNCTTNIDAYASKNSIIVNIDGNPLDDFRIYINGLVESWNTRKNKFSDLQNGNYTVYITENKKLVWSNIFEIKEPNTVLNVDDEYIFYYGEKCKIYASIPLDDSYATANPVLIFNGTIIKGKEIDNDGYDAEYVFSFKKSIGKYAAELRLDDGNYYAKPVGINIEIKKSSPIITTKTAYSTTKSYATLRAVVEDQYGNYINEGVVNFTVNGKTYSVSVKDGEAIKKIKLTAAKTYTLKTTFSSANHYIKSVSSKVIVSKAKSSYIIKIGKYSCKISFNDYKKILDAKSWNSVFYKKYNTKKTIKIKYYTYTTKKVTYTKKKLSYHSWVKNGNTYYESYDSAYNTPKGYKYAGYKTIKKGNDIKEYLIYKKTVNKKIKSQPKYKNFKVYILVDTYRWSKNHAVVAMASTDSFYLRNLDKDYNYYSKEIIVK